MNKPLHNEFDEEVHGSFLLKPHRSLSESSRKLYYGSLLVAGALSNYFAIKAGVWPIAAMIDVTLGGAALAMRASVRSGNEYEMITVSDSTLEIRHFKPGFEQEHVRRLPSFMLKVEAVYDRFDNCRQILLKSQGGQTEIGKFLGPVEKRQAELEIKAALKRASLPHHLREAPITKGYQP